MLTNDQSSTNVTYYFVIQNNSPAKQLSDVLLHYAITAPTSSLSGEMYYALIPVIIGIALIALGVLPKAKPEVIPPPPMPEQKQEPQPQVRQLTNNPTNAALATSGVQMRVLRRYNESKRAVLSVLPEVSAVRAFLTRYSSQG